MQGTTLRGLQVTVAGQARDVEPLVQVIAGIGPDGNPSGGIATTPQGAAHGAVTVIPTTGQTAGTSTVAARPTRAGAMIQNYSTSPETLWFGYASGVNASTGVQLLAGQSCPISNVGALFFFSVIGTATGVVIEDYN